MRSLTLFQLSGGYVFFSVKSKKIRAIWTSNQMIYGLYHYRSATRPQISMASFFWHSLGVITRLGSGILTKDLTWPNTSALRRSDMTSKSTTPPRRKSKGSPSPRSVQRSRPNGRRRGQGQSFFPFHLHRPKNRSRILVSVLKNPSKIFSVFRFSRTFYYSEKSFFFQLRTIKFTLKSRPSLKILFRLTISKLCVKTYMWKARKSLL